MITASVEYQEPDIVQVGRVSRAASSASMAAICAWIGARAGEPGRARARLAASSRRVRSSSPQELAPAEPGTPFLAGTEGCP